MPVSGIVREMFVIPSVENYKRRDSLHNKVLYKVPAPIFADRCDAEELVVGLVVQRRVVAAALKRSNASFT